MAFSGFYSRLRRLYKFSIASPKRWVMPKTCDVLIYDASGSSVFEVYLRGLKVETLALNGEFVYMRCLLRSVLSSAFWTGRPYEAYTDCFIRAASPALVLTFIDNDQAFYELSMRFPNIKTMFVQNGSRSEIGDVFDSLQQSNRYHVDFMLVHGLAIGRHYQKYISGKSIVIGSMRSNAVSLIPASNTTKTILFVSHYLQRPDGNKPLLVRSNGASIGWDQFFAAEKSVLPFLDQWCVENGYALQVLGRELMNQSEERAFYDQHLKEVDWEYVERSSNRSPYHAVDKADIVVFIDSTLGYESFGRGKRTASFSCRGATTKNEATKFGWPLALPDNGPFWTNLPCQKEYRRVMNFLDTVDAEDWDRTRSLYADELMKYDDGNAIFEELLPIAISKPLFDKVVTRF